MATEASIRRNLREDVHADLKYTVRGKRGAGKTKEAILDRVRWRRRWHTGSIRRMKEGSSVNTNG